MKNIKEQKILGVHHSADLDGLMSGAIIKYWANKQKKDLTLIGWDYGQKIPDNILEYDFVIMSDISFPKDTMKKLKEHYKDNFLWYDHHERTYTEMSDLKIGGNQTKDLSAQEITFNELLGDDFKMPNIVLNLGLYDSFRHFGTDMETKIFKHQLGARLLLKDFNGVYTSFVYALNDKKYDDELNAKMIEYGDVLYKQSELDANDVLNRLGYEKEIKGKKFFVYNKDRLNIFNFLKENQIKELNEKYHGVCSWQYYPDINKFKASLYSQTNDMSIIAKEFGGGGHAGASGFQTDDVNVFINQAKNKL